MTPIEQNVLKRLATQGPIHRTALVGYAFWPDRSMQPQGAALAAGKVLRGLRDDGYVESHSETVPGQRAKIPRSASVPPRGNQL